MKYLSNKNGFLGIDNKFNFKEKVVVIPFGLEKTVSYGGGTRNGPKEIIKASSIVLGIPKKEHIEEDPIRKGKVDFYNDDKGFGFIIDAENNEKYFVHVSGLKQPISEGDKVTYELERGMKGMNAVRVSHI